MLLKLRQKGSVLILALVIMVVVSGISVEMLVRGRFEIRQADQISTYNHIYLDLQGFQYWAIQALQSYNPDKKREPMKFKSDTLERGALISGGWQDQRGFFNINALSNVNAAVGQGFTNLLENVVPDLEKNEINLIVKQIKTYLRLNGKMLSVTELRYIEALSQDAYLRIFPYLTALPSNEHKININAIDMKNEDAPKVLLTVLAASSNKGLEAIRLCYSGDYIDEKNCSEFLKCVTQNKSGVKADFLSCKSPYFLAIGSVKIEDQIHTLYVFLQKLGVIDKTSVSSKPGEDKDGFDSESSKDSKPLKEKKEESDSDEKSESEEKSGGGAKRPAEKGVRLLWQSLDTI